MIQAFQLTKVYDAGDRPALKDVRFALQKGEFVFLTGASGAGKTTLLRLLFGAERPTRGQLYVNNRDMSHLHGWALAQLRREIGVVFQDFKLVPTQTVAENVAYALHVVGMPDRSIKRRVTQTLGALGLLHKARTLPPKLSGGEQQRVAIARALVNDPVILLADEPTGNLDADLTPVILELLEQANARGTTVMVATHDRHLLATYKKRVLTLQQGEMDEDEHFQSEDITRVF
ncbi:MAG: cell division ATP-binding protein FtsE [Myxococcales bacterium]|nr:cell division ATP-binding protein FtsE [Myxococcales bacterium]